MHPPLFFPFALRPFNPLPDCIDGLYHLSAATGVNLSFAAPHTGQANVCRLAHLVPAGYRFLNPFSSSYMYAHDVHSNF